MKSLIKNYKKEFIIMGILIGLILIIFLFQIFQSKETTNKILENHDYIIEKESLKEENIITHRLPYINLNNKAAELINKEIISKYYLLKETENSIFDYTYTKTDDIISLLITSSICEYGDSCKAEYISYNFDIKNNKLLNNEDLLNMYNYDLDIIEKTIKNKLNEYYNHELTNKYIDKNMSFEQYLSDRNIDDYNDVNIYINKDNKIIIYKTYTLSSGISIDEEFISNPFEFEIN
ncbi:MAG: hypothetical protein IJO32_07840 [Bacilli bacterium]|nr:hypothetical protein [Bacilli bacterium]